MAPSHDAPTASSGGIERRNIDMVPDAERHGSPWSQFTLWFGANLQITAIVTGSLAVVFGADAWTSILGLLIGQLIGGAVMALHSAQGPRLGLPQMISSRAQFGVFGAAFPLLLVLLLYLGFSATGTVLAGEAINSALGTGHKWVGICLFAAITAAIAIFGYSVIHQLGRVSSIVGLVGLGYVAIRLFRTKDFGPALSHAHLQWPTFLLAISLSAGWQLTFGPYAGDYSRYLPRSTPFARAWLGPFAGSVLGATISMTLGVFIAVAGGDAFLDNQIGYVGNLAQGHVLAELVFVTIVVGKLTINTLNAYGGVMAVATAMSGFTGRDHISPRLRMAFVVLFNLLVVAIALWASKDFLGNFKNFVLALLMFFIPWSAINLINYYLIARGNIDIPALYTARGRYGAVSWSTIAVYVIGVLAQVPFLAQAIYTGPLTRALGGADISWIVGLVVTAALYWPVGHRAFRYPDRLVLPEQPGQGSPVA